MDQQKKDRINYLARRSREVGLSEAEKQEQAELRAEYLREFRAGFQNILDHTVVERPDGSRTPLNDFRRATVPTPPDPEKK